MISILIPSRGRPHKLRDCLRSIYDKALKSDLVETIVRLDDDDPELPRYMPVIAQYQCRFIVAGRGFGYARNDKLIEECAGLSTGWLIMQFVDTAEMMSDYWDETLREQAKSSWFVMFPTVLPSGSYRFSFPTISRKVYEACGCFCLGENPSVDRCWAAFIKHLDIEVPSGIEVKHTELRGTKQQDDTAAESQPFYAELSKNWKKRSAEFEEIGKRYADIVREKIHGNPLGATETQQVPDR